MCFCFFFVLGARSLSPVRRYPSWYACLIYFYSQDSFSIFSFYFAHRQTHSLMGGLVWIGYRQHKQQVPKEKTLSINGYLLYFLYDFQGKFKPLCLLKRQELIRWKSSAAIKVSKGWIESNILCLTWHFFFLPPNFYVEGHSRQQAALMVPWQTFN